jgi:cytochrome c-type biogenesis protein CcmE
MKKGAWLAVLGALVFVALGVYSFKKSLTPYVPFAEARKTPGVVQVAGTLVKGSGRYTEADKSLHFLLQEKQGTDTLEVVYGGAKPVNFEDATSIVAIGIFEQGKFSARQLLVKCPSKYQGTQQDRTYGS